MAELLFGQGCWEVTLHVLLFEGIQGHMQKILLGWHSTSRPNHRMWFMQLKYPRVSSEYLAKLFCVPARLFFKGGIDLLCVTMYGDLSVYKVVLF